MGVNRTGATENIHSEQSLQNTSFDREFGVFVYEPLTLNPVSGDLERSTTIQGNSSFTLSYDINGNLETIEKVIGATTYTKTLGYSSGNLVSVSTWS